MRGRWMAVLVGAVGLALAGCGSSGGLSRAKLAAKVNSICAKYNTQLNTVTAPADFTTNPVAAAAYLDKVQALLKPDLAAVKKLKPASSVKADWNAFVAALSHEFGLFFSADAKAHAKDRSGLQDIQTADAYNKSTLDPASRRLGLSKCGE